MSSPVPMRTLVLGGTRSGKSGYAESLLDAERPVRYAATARRIPGDDDWDRRIAAHAARRPSSWVTVESPDLVAELAGPGPLLVDDLATWLTGRIDDASGWTAEHPPPEIDDAVQKLVDAVRRAPGRVVLVSAEVGLGVVPETRSGRMFRDHLGALNAALAEVCDEVVLMVAGRIVPLAAVPGARRADDAPPARPEGAAPVDGPHEPGADDRTPPSGTSTAAAAVGGAAVGGAAVHAVAGGTAADSSAENGSAGGTAVDDATENGSAGSLPVGHPATDGPASTGAPAGDTPASGAGGSSAAAGAVATAEREPGTPEPVGRPDVAARREAIARVAELAIPVGGLGALAELGAWLAACHGECPPRPPVQARVLLLAADHGIAEAGVSAYDQRVGQARATAATAGTLPVTVAARAAGAAVRTVDVGLAAPLGDGGEHVVLRGSGRIDRADALTEEQAERAYRTGQRLADDEIDAGADVLVPATLAVAATTPASVLVAALTGAEPVAVIGRGSGIDDRTWMRKATAVRDALRRARPHLRDPLALLRTVGGADLVVLAGFLARAADRRVPAVLDGLAVGAAALLAEELAPGAREWWVAAQASSEPAMALVLEHLSLTPVQDLAVRTDDGTAAVAVLPLLVTAARLIAETGTAAGTGISPIGAG